MAKQDRAKQDHFFSDLPNLSRVTVPPLHWGRDRGTVQHDEAIGPPESE